MQSLSGLNNTILGVKDDPATYDIKKPLFRMIMDHAPLDGKADDRISVELQPLEIIYNKVSIDQLIGFMMPAIDDSSKAKLMQLAGEKMQQLDRATRATLEHQLQEHKVCPQPNFSFSFLNAHQ